MKHYNVAVIGGGPGGYETAIRLNQYGIECVVIEKERLGGICLNWGCIPTKALVKSAELWHEINQAESFGLSVKREQLDYSKIYTRKNEVVEKLVSGVEFLFNKRKIPIIKAAALSVEKVADGFMIYLSDEEILSSDFVILATGSVPKDLPFIKIDEIDILSSTGILHMSKLPASLAVIGGGVVGCEFAYIYSSLGVEVHLIEFLPSIVSTEDEEISKRLQMFLKKGGIKIQTGFSVTGCTKTKDGLILNLSDNSQLIVEKVLLSVGRKPNINIKVIPDLNLLKDSSIAIDNLMRTNVEGIYAIGDVTNKMPLAHTASKQGLIAAAHIKSLIEESEFESADIIYENIPRCTFTNPEVASCGLTEKQASEQIGQIKVGRFPFTANGKAMAGGNTNGFVKVIAAANDMRIVGMHIIGPNAAELIAQGSILINLKASAKDVEKVIFAHPTLSEANMEAIEDLHGLSIHKI